MLGQLLWRLWDRKALRPASERSWQIEQLETRLVPALNPTGLEQEMLEMVNRMRANPSAELGILTDGLGTPAHSADPDINGALQYFNVNGSVLSAQWSTLSAVPPLAWNESLQDAAAGHNLAMIAADEQTHQVDGEPNLATRVVNAGYTNWSVLGENVYGYGESVLHAHAAFVIDWGLGATGIQDPPGHRNNIMDVNYTHREIGISIIEQTNPSADLQPLVFTQDFGDRFSFGNPFLLGVVFNDGNGNGDYNAGEGLDQFTITATGPGGTYTATSMSAGGYQMQVPAGSYTVTATRSGYNSTSHGVVVGTDNVKVDFTPTAASATLDSVGVHRGSMWYLDADGSQSWNVPGDSYFSFGISTDEPIVGDWNGDGDDEIGIHRGNMWYLDYDGNGQWNVPGDQYFHFGIVGDEPVVGDWDGDGTDEVGVHRGSAWYLDADGSQAWNTSGDQYFCFGINGDEPLVGDWNGDGTDEVGVHRGDAWYLDSDGSHGWNVPGDEYFRFGIPGDEPLVGDWNADGTDEIGVHRGDTWYLDTDGSGAWNVPGDEYFHFGIPGDQPVVGHWQSSGGGASQATVASSGSVLPADPGQALMVESLSTNGSTTTDATQVDRVFAAEPAALPSAAQSGTELALDAISNQVARSHRLGSGGLLDLPTAKVHDQALKELLQSIWWLAPDEPSLA